MKPFLKTKDYSVSGETFELFHDDEFDMLLTRPQPENLQRYYQSDAYISHTDSKQSFLDKIYQAVKKVNLHSKIGLINRYAQENKYILDVGAGTGDFLIAAKKRGWSVEGIEPNYEARMRSREKKMELYSALQFLPRRKFQIITLWHVMEHLPDLDNQIAKFKALLEDEGVLIIAVPNFKSHDAEYYKEFWAAYDVPRHLWHFSRTSVNKIFSEHGMKVMKTRPMLFDAFYVSLLSEKYKSGNNNFIRALAVGGYSNLKAIFTREYSSIVYIVKKAF